MARPHSRKRKIKTSSNSSVNTAQKKTNNPQYQPFIDLIDWIWNHLDWTKIRYHADTEAQWIDAPIMHTISKLCIEADHANKLLRIVLEDRGGEETYYSACADDAGLYSAAEEYTEAIHTVFAYSKVWEGQEEKRAKCFDLPAAARSRVSSSRDSLLLPSDMVKALKRIINDSARATD